MIRLLIATHGELASGLLNSSKLIIGDFFDDSTTTIAMNFDTAVSEFQNSIKEHLESLKEDDQLLVLTDIFGGSVTKLIAEYIPLFENKLFVISGVNLGMILEALLTKDNKSIDELIKDLVKAGKESVIYINDALLHTGGDEI